MEGNRTTEIMTFYKRAPVLLIFIAHFIFSTWGAQGYWTPNSYFFYNAFFIGTLLWTHSSSSVEPAIICLTINYLSIIFDVIVLSIYFPRDDFGSANRFSAGMAILNLVLRPLSAAVLYRTCLERMRENPQRNNYEDLPGS